MTPLDELRSAMARIMSDYLRTVSVPIEQAQMQLAVDAAVRDVARKACARLPVSVVRMANDGAPKPAPVVLSEADIAEGLRLGIDLRKDENACHLATDCDSAEGRHAYIGLAG